MASAEAKPAAYPPVALHQAARHQRPAVDQNEQKKLERGRLMHSALERITDSNPTAREVRKVPTGDLRSGFRMKEAAT
jgi:hypothetical protein